MAQKLTGSDEETTRIMAEKRAAAARAASPNDGIESSSFTPFTPATTALEALDNANAGYTPDGDLLCVDAPPGQAQALLARAIAGESGVGVYLRTVQTTDVAVPIVIGSGDDSLAELDASHCLPANRLDYDLAEGGLEPLPIGRFRGAKSAYAITLLMRGCGWLRTQAQIDYGKPAVDLGLALPLAKAKRGVEDAAKAKALLDPFVPQPNEPATDEQIAIAAAAVAIGKAFSAFTTATQELDARMHEPARMKTGASHGADEWGLDPTKNGTQMAMTFSLEEAFKLWQDNKAKGAGMPGAGASGGEIGQNAISSAIETQRAINRGNKG